MHRHALRARGRGSSVLLGAALALLAFTATTTAAFADGAVSKTGSQYVFQAGEGDFNHVDLSQNGTGVRFYDYNNAVTADASALAGGCAQTDANTVDCDTAGQGITGLGVNLGDIGDDLSSGSATLPLTVDGGTGDDNLNAGEGPDTVYGGEGNDKIDGAGGADAIDTGSGNDKDVYGGRGDDSISTGDGDDWFVYGGPGHDSISTGDGNESYVYGDCYGVCAGGQPGNDTIDLGGGYDFYVEGGDGNDTIVGGAGNDFSLEGGHGDDTVDAGAGDDYLSSDDVCAACGGSYTPGPNGSDVLLGGAGNDSIYDDSGSDVLDGGAGDDYLYTWDRGNEHDTVRGGDGVDSFTYDACCEATDLITITLDDRADDGSKLHDGANNVASDIENVEIEGGGAKANLVGSAAANSLKGGNTVTGAGGPDYLFATAGNDTVYAQDGYPDSIECDGGDADVANVDQFDTVVQCETVNRVTLGSAYDDAAPTIAWAKPVDNARVRAGTDNPLEVTTSDDRGIAQVVFLAGTRIVCVDTAAPYACAYRPPGTDVGRTTLTAVANDTSRQSATALRNVVVGRFGATRLTARTSPAKDTTDPHRFTTTGRLRLPAGVSTRDGCDGVVAVTIKAGKKTLSDHRVALKDDCTYRSRVSFSIPSRLNRRTLTVRARFAGNRVLLPERAGLHKVRVAR